MTLLHALSKTKQLEKVDPMKVMLRVLFVFSCLLSFSGSVGAQDLKAGAATVDVTPPVGYAMWGYGARHDKPSVGVLDPLHARALVIEMGGERIAIVALDLGRAPPRHSTAVIEKAVKAEAGVNHIFLVGSHTHHGPVLEVDTWPNPEHSYVRELEKKLTGVIVEAARNLQPARLGIASKEVPYNRNRHSKGPRPPVDREFLVLRVESIGRKTDRLCRQLRRSPNDVRRQDDEILSGLPRCIIRVRAKADRTRLASFCRALRATCPRIEVPPRDPVEFGQLLAREALALASTIHCESPKEGTLKVADDDFHFKSRVDLANPAIKFAFVRNFYPDLVDFYVREYKDGVRPRMTTALLDGRIGIVGVSGEFFCGHSLALKRRAGLEHVLFLGYCNDYQQYFPTIEAASEGGYGARRRRLHRGSRRRRTHDRPRPDPPVQDARQAQGLRNNRLVNVR